MQFYRQKTQTATNILMQKNNETHLTYWVFNIYVYYIYSALTNFKRAIFTCEKMEDTEKDGIKDGRIDTIVFKQIS